MSQPNMNGGIPPDKVLTAWRSDGYITNRIKQPYISRKRDFTFSTYMEIPGKFGDEKRQWVLDFLAQHGCFKEVNDDPAQIIKAMRISSNTRKEQVLIECKTEEQVAGLAEALKNIPGPFHMWCPAMMPVLVPVYISWVRSSVEIQKHLIDNFLSKYGRVHSHRPMVDKRGIETFEHCFMMNEEDLLNNPPPNFVWMGRSKLRVKFRGQKATCYICDCPDHVAGDCPNKKQKNRDNDHPVFIPPRYESNFPPLNNQMPQTQDNSGTAQVPSPSATNKPVDITQEHSASATISVSQPSTESVPNKKSNSVLTDLYNGSAKRKTMDSDSESNSSTHTIEEVKKTKTGPSLGQNFVETAEEADGDDDNLGNREDMDVGSLFNMLSDNTVQPEKAVPPAAPPELPSSE